MGKIAQFAKKISEDKRDILIKLKDDEKKIKILYWLIVEELVKIGNTARLNQASTAEIELREYVSELKNIVDYTSNNKVKNDLLQLITHINRFLQEFPKLKKKDTTPDPFYTSESQKINSVLGFLANSIKTVLGKDLRIQNSEFGEIEYLLRKAA